MSLNQLLYNDSNVDTNNRPWLNVVVNSMRFGAKGDGFDQQVLDYYTYDPDAPNVLALTPSAGTITGGSLTVDVARLGRMVTLQFATTASLVVSAPCQFVTSAISSNIRPRVATRFYIPALFTPDDPAAYNDAPGMLGGTIATSGVITFDSMYFLGPRIAGGGAGDAFQAITRDGADGGISGGSIDIVGGCVSYLHAV